MMVKTLLRKQWLELVALEASKAIPFMILSYFKTLSKFSNVFTDFDNVLG